MAIGSVLLDRVRVDFTIAGGGTTSGTDYATTANHSYLVVATCVGKYNGGGFGCRVEAVYGRGAANAVLATTIAATDGNPATVAAHVYGADAAFCSGGAGVGPSTLVLTGSAGNIHFAITNNGAGANDFTLIYDVFDVG